MTYLTWGPTLPAGRTEEEKLMKPTQAFPLWQGDAPGALGDAPEDIPTLKPYWPDPEVATGASVVVCPGGGYVMHAVHEGGPVAQWLAGIGIAAFVLRYRLGPRYRHPVMLGDVSRALRVVRAHSAEWNLDGQRTGVLGFSAGGHLASTATTLFAAGDRESSDPVERVSSRPDAAVLIYPVIALNPPFAHIGSRDALLGPGAAVDNAESLSTHLRVTAKTPPTFLVHSFDDTAVPPENSLQFYQALRAHGVPAELHLFDHGGHGFGLGALYPSVGTWPKLCEFWLKRTLPGW